MPNLGKPSELPVTRQFRFVSRSSDARSLRLPRAGSKVMRPKKVLGGTKSPTLLRPHKPLMIVNEEARLPSLCSWVDTKAATAQELETREFRRRGRRTESSRSPHGVAEGRVGFKILALSQERTRRVSSAPPASAAHRAHRRF